jgi:Na+-dependent bicarbonate transporter superfamily
LSGKDKYGSVWAIQRICLDSMRSILNQNRRKLVLPPGSATDGAGPVPGPTLRSLATLGLTFSYNLTIGIPVYIEITKRAKRYIGQDEPPHGQ